jgi:GTP1/Obg family GTP-binding protein
VKLLKKNPFIEFVGEFKSLPWEMRKAILDDYPEIKDIDKLHALYKDLIDEIIDPDDWKSLFL